MLGLSRARVHQLVTEPDFPAHLALKMGRVWWMSDFRAWAHRSGRQLRELPDSWPTLQAVNPQDDDRGRYRPRSR